MIRPKQVFLYIILGLFSAMTALAGVPKLLGLSFVVDQLAALGYSQVFTHFIGLCWVCAAIGVWFSKLRSIVVLCTIPIVSGALASHITHGDGFYYSLLAFVVLGGLILYLDGFYGRIIAPKPKRRIEFEQNIKKRI
jgi:hypothetical protein